jgi:hypothetical protein
VCSVSIYLTSSAALDDLDGMLLPEGRRELFTRAYRNTYSEAPRCGRATMGGFPQIEKRPGDRS